ncbi:MAG TPA: hypothetical protein VEL76_27545 [Gemmataceae bacterium]|nr:hypothetical protein [Gemmataceae bacterium]
MARSQRGSQAEVGPDGAITYGVIGPHEVRVIPGKDVEKTKSIRDWKRETDKDNQGGSGE